MRRRAENPDYRPFAVGEKVWLEGKHIATTHPSPKLAPRRYGPYAVKEVLSPLTFKLALPGNLKLLHPVFHASLLSPYKETTEHGPSASRPGPVLVEGEEEYEVDRILQSRIKKRGRNQWVEYLIKWKGYNEEEETTWKPARDLAHAQEAIQEFHQTFPSAPIIRTLTEVETNLPPALNGGSACQLPRHLIPDYVHYITDRLDRLVVSSVPCPPHSPTTMLSSNSTVSS